MTIDEVPLTKRFFEIVTFHGDRFKINNLQRETIFKSSSQFIAFPNGEMLNKSEIRMVVIDKEKTKKVFLASYKGKKLVE